MKLKQSVADNKEMILLWDKNNNKNPSNISVWSKEIFSWKCKEGHSWKANAEKIYTGCRCPFCSGRYASVENNLSTKFPNLISEWDFDKNEKHPSKITPKCGKPYYWKCKKGHSWKASPHNRATGQRCPFCQNKKVNSDNCFENDKNFNYLIHEWDFSKNKILPSDVVSGSTTKVYWKCKNNHSWIASIKNRTQHLSGCPSCKKIELKDGQIFNSLIETYYYITMKKMNILFERQKKYPNSNMISDFYLPKSKTFVELTGYTENNMFNNDPKHYKQYMEKIDKKRNIAISNNFKFKFVQRPLTKREKAKIQKNRK